MSILIPEFGGVSKNLEASWSIDRMRKPSEKMILKNLKKEKKWSEILIVICKIELSRGFKKSCRWFIWNLHKESEEISEESHKIVEHLEQCWRILINPDCLTQENDPIFKRAAHWMINFQRRPKILCANPQWGSWKESKRFSLKNDCIRLETKSCRILPLN